MSKYVCVQGGSAELIEKKSRFIANVERIASEQEALDFIESIRKKYRDAKHNCFAYITADGRISRFSDDKEPQGTAGKPILEVLQHKDISGICVVVTRYFGGILLGTGGLIRAYQNCAIEGVKSGKILEKRYGFRLQFHIRYEDYGKFNYICEKYETIRETMEYTDKIDIKLVIEEMRRNDFLKEIAEESAGKIEPLKNDGITYVLDENTILEWKQ